MRIFRRSLWKRNVRVSVDGCTIDPNRESFPMERVPWKLENSGDTDGARSVLIAAVGCSAAAAESGKSAKASRATLESKIALRVRCRRGACDIADAQATRPKASFGESRMERLRCRSAATRRR